MARITPAIGRITVLDRFWIMAKNTAVPPLGRHAHLTDDAAHLFIGGVEHPGQIADDAADQHLLQPIRNAVPDKIHEVTSNPSNPSRCRKCGQFGALTVGHICKLGVLSTLGFFHGVPQGLAVCVFWRCMGRQENGRADHAALSGVVAVATISIITPIILDILFSCKAPPR